MAFFLFFAPTIVCIVQVATVCNAKTNNFKIDPNTELSQCESGLSVWKKTSKNQAEDVMAIKKIKIITRSKANPILTSIQIEAILGENPFKMAASKTITPDLPQIQHIKHNSNCTSFHQIGLH